MDHVELEPIDDDELLYRRVPAAAFPRRYDPATRELSGQAFAPHENDLSGLSVSRGKFKSVEEAALGRPGKSYYVAILRAGDLKTAGIAVVPRPQSPDGYDAAHAELPDLNAGNRKDNITLERQQILTELCLDVVGPFETPPD